MPVHQLASLTWPAVRDLPAAGTAAVLPAGAIEAHGPHLPLGTDVIIAEAMARAGAERLAARGWHVLLLPALHFTPAPFASAFAGTIDAPPEAATIAIDGIVRSLSAHGIRIVAIANAHHDPANVRALRDAVARASTGGATVVFPDLTRRRWAERLTPEFQSGACHAGRYETSILLAQCPDLVHREVMLGLAPNPRSLIDAIRANQTTFSDAGGSEAYFGFPADATAEEGQAIVEALGAILEEAVVEAIEGGGSETGVPTARTGRGGVLNPPELGPPRGFAHGILARAGGRTLFVAGQIGIDAQTVDDFVAQFDRALARVLVVVGAAGGRAEDIARITIYVTSIERYRESRTALRDVWQRHMGSHYPAMALVGVTALVDPSALVEIEATAVLA